MAEIVCHSLNLRLIASREVLGALVKYRQKSGMKEAGGLLFGKYSRDQTVTLTNISAPNRWDRRSQYGFEIHQKRAQKTIERQFKRGLHYLGDWHSHPEPAPSPSPIDIRTIKEIYRQSNHELNYLLMLIIGSTPDFTNSYAAFTDGFSHYPCEIRCPPSTEIAKLTPRQF